MNTQSTADRIVQRFSTRPHSPFPTKEIATLIPNKTERSLFHGRLDMFLSGIAGYASSASRLQRRSAEELQAAKQFLSHSFFEKYSEYVPYKGKITQQDTPTLFVEMETAELNRLDLLEVVERLLKSE